MSANRRAAQAFYDEFIWPDRQLTAEMGRRDRFFLLTWLLDRKDADQDWIYRRCREVQRAPDDHLDLWAREHYKSTIITFAGIIQEIINDPEITVGIFSHNRPTAKKFMNQIKFELESNNTLKKLYPDVLWKHPSREAPRWSEDRGLIVKRKGNPKEATLEANGLVEGMPTGAHYKLRVYDDVVTEDSVTSPEMMAKTTDAWRLSQSLGTVGGRVWYIGTRYHFNDTYRVMLDNEVVTPRIYPATDDSTPGGNSVLFPQEYIERKRREQGPYIFSCQLLLNPVADEAQGFKREWLDEWDEEPGGTNNYIIVDPASEKKKSSDYSAFFVVGLGADRNYYILDIIRDRLNLKERADALFALHAKWKPIAVGYEKYGKDSDIEHLEDRMKRENYRFHITKLGGSMAKADRIRRLIPICEQNRLFLPEALWYTDYSGRQTDLVKDFIEQEYLGFPVATHDDMMDCLSRILDPGFPTNWPSGLELIEGTGRDRYSTSRQRRHSSRTWMSF